jgi:hypothetical protein
LIGGWVPFIFGAQFGAYVGINIAALPWSRGIGDRQACHRLSAAQSKMTNAGPNTCAGRLVVLWPLFNSIAWAGAAAFLGFMRVVKYNEGLVALAYIPTLIETTDEWQPPDSIFVEGATILLALAIVHVVSRWRTSPEDLTTEAST